MEIKAVIGANWGDEGKGLMTHHFSQEAANDNKKAIVVCNNGGAQRGHTVVTSSGLRHVFKHFGSGTFDGADTYLPKDFILNPMIFIKELGELNDMGYHPNVYVHPQCVWSTPYDMLLNQVIEDSRGINRHGSCGVGIWETILRTSYKTSEEYRRYSHIEDLNYYDPSVIYNFVLNIKNKYCKEKLRDCNVPDEWMKIISSDGLFNHFMLDLYSMLSYIRIVDTRYLNNYDTVIFENAQGLMLDTKYSKDVNTTTPSNTGIKNVLKNIHRGNLCYSDVEICYVTRTYSTRHGVGFLPNECNSDCINSTIYDQTNQHNDYQGELRYGKLDYDSLFSRINTDFHSVKLSDQWHCSVGFTHSNEAPISLPDYIVNAQNKFYESDNEKSVKLLDK